MHHCQTNSSVRQRNLADRSTASHASRIVQWRFCSARGAILGVDSANDCADTMAAAEQLSEVAMLALGAAHAEDDASIAARAAYTSEQAVRIAL